VKNYPQGNNAKQSLGGTIISQRIVRKRQQYDELRKLFVHCPILYSRNTTKKSWPCSRQSNNYTSFILFKWK